jgi:hypothetical protein
MVLPIEEKIYFGEVEVMQEKFRRVLDWNRQG